MIKKIIKRLLTFFFHPSTIIHYRNFRKTILAPSVVLKNPKYMKLINCEFARGCTIKCFPTSKGKKILLEATNSYFGDEVYLSSGGGVKINGITCAPKVFISSYKHVLPISIHSQELTDSHYLITILPGTFIGQSACIAGNITIGNNCVIGFGTIVTKSIENDCMCVGNPGRVIKRYNRKNGEWERYETN